VTVERLIAIAAGVVGHGEADPAFRALCGPGETEQRQRELARLGTCALFLRGCLAHACSGWGLREVELSLAGNVSSRKPERVPPRLWAPYVTGHAMGDLVATCRSVAGPGAHTRHLMIVPGAMVIVGRETHLHVYLVESVERDGWPDGSIEVTTIEAGQTDGDGRQRVERKRHEIDASGTDRITVEQDHALGEWIPSSIGPCPRPVAYVLGPRALLERT
jgi:hypothetical protein